jgi:hypothetical protein
MEAADTPTIRQILEDYDLEDLLGSPLFESLAEALTNRENIMVVEIGPRIWAKGLDTIINQH